MRRLLLLGALVAAPALVVSDPADAHLDAQPAFLTAGGKERIVLTVHNDRDETMTGFRLEVPAGIEVVAPAVAAGWTAEYKETSVTWSDGTLAAAQPVRFEVELDATRATPGPVQLDGEQRYPDGESVRWPVTLTVVPPGGSVASDEGTFDGAAVTILAVLGLLVLGTFGLVLWQRRRPRETQ